MPTTSTSRRRILAALSITVAAGIALSACSSSGSSSSSSNEITFRLVAAEGSGLTNYPDAQAGAKAAVQAINKAGGVNGKKIDFSFCNTRGDSNQAVTCARQAINDKVDALVGDVDIYSTASLPVLEGGKIPAIGLVATNTEDSKSSVAYPINAGNYGNFTAAPALFKAAGFKKMAVIQLDFAATKESASYVEKAAKAIGMPSAGEITVPGSGVTDYAPYVEQIKEKGADCTLVLLGPAGLQAVYKAAEATGVKTQFAGSVFSFGESEAQAVGSTASNGVWVTSPLPAPNDTSIAAVKEYNEELTASGVAENDAVLRRAAGLNAWLSVYAAAEVAKGISGEVTAASMTAALKSTKPIDVKGLVTWDPASLGSADLGIFPRLPDVPVNVATFKNGKMVPTDVQPDAAPLADVRK